VHSELAEFSHASLNASRFKGGSQSDGSRCGSLIELLPHSSMQI